MQLEGLPPLPPLEPILNHMNPIHTLPPYFHKIHSNIIYLSMPRFSAWSFSFRRSNQNFVSISYLSHACRSKVSVQVLGLCNIL